MTRYWKYFAVALLGLAIFVPAASARPGFGFRGYFGGPYYGPAYYGYGGWYGPGWEPYAVAPVAYTGKVKIETKMKDASVFVDGDYAGTVGQLKTFPLRPGVHNIDVRDPSGHTIYQERINVIAGKTTKLAA